MSESRPSPIVFEGVGYDELRRFGESEVAAELFTDEALDGKTFMRYLDKSGSVSAVDEDEGAIWDFQLLDEQFRRNFHNG